MVQEELNQLSLKLNGELHTSDAMRILYATDASAYRELPLAVVMPKNEQDLIELVKFVSVHHLSLIPRTAGTSLAGQVVGNGIVLDLSKHFDQVLEVNPEERWVRVQPGYVRDDLNRHLATYGLMFGPETATANRAMIGGMIGNNSCGANSIVYGSTREHLIEVRAVLSDGSVTTFGPLTDLEFVARSRAAETASDLETSIYRSLKSLLSDEKNSAEIKKEFPKASIPRRNTGYALDMLLNLHPFNQSGDQFNLCKLLAGSEGTLALVTEAKLNLVPIPPSEGCMVCVHFDSIHESLLGNLVALKYQPTACELMDHYILECTKENIEQRKNRFFVKGDPKAIIVVEFRCESEAEWRSKAEQLIAELKSEALGYHYPVVTGDDMPRVWQLRKAGLGLLANIPGEAKAAPVIEDTAVDVRQLPEYIKEFNQILNRHGLFSVHYAHAGTGELHLRPILNLKSAHGQKMFRVIAEEIARLVKKYNGSLSGEHGDGRLRGEFIPYMVGNHNYRLFQEVKKTWDPLNIFNPGKIVNSPPMDENLRYEPGQITRTFETVFDFEPFGGIVQAAEQCNGSADCRKTVLSGGTMCPSYMATKNEKDTTRARANILREMLTRSEKTNPFAEPEIKEVMDLCLSCKGCKSECPSNVDIAKLKAEFLQQRYNTEGIPLRTRMIAGFDKVNEMASQFPALYNFLVTNKITSTVFKYIAGFATERSLPRLHTTTLKNWFKEQSKDISSGKKVLLFCDEFTNYNDTTIGITAVKLLQQLDYQVIIPNHLESGRALLSKGMLIDAQKLAIRNVELLKDKVSESNPLLGIEPSAILTFRDEYPALVPDHLKEAAVQLAANTYTIEEFLAAEMELGNISSDQFIDEKRLIRLHGHCHQKAISSVLPTKKILSLPANYTVQLIPSGCCGMAGSFGYEKEHYQLSMQIGELVLFPTVRELDENVLVAAPGTSCRHQIMDGTGKKALHPVEILWEALK
ncbi:MAG: oxidoreductase [Cyclobacteriaceae bacterium]|nr:MAG: oxidoreductase [Cyclobacteriaceae bacterium]